ncbi:MAG TPA: GNAT family N-acetyltransferase [Promineifilum sp.]
MNPPDETITLPNSPDVPGLSFRHFRGPSDYPGITSTGNASREASGAELVLSVDDIALEYAHQVNTDPVQDMIIAEIDGNFVGYSQGDWSQEKSGLIRYWFELNLMPERWGLGIRRAMLLWMEARMRQVAAEHPPDAPKTFATDAPEKAVTIANLLEGEGYRPARYFNKMTQLLDEPLPDFPMPPGLEMRPVLPEHYRQIWDASQEAFMDHWGFSPAPDEYYHWWLEDPVIFTPELWQVAWDIEKDEIAGQVRTFIDVLENERYKRLRGYTEMISVRRPYRRRGLARALIAQSLRVLKAQGMTESALSVDTESLTGATRIYEDCGFRVTSRSIAYRKPLEIGSET